MALLLFVIPAVWLGYLLGRLVQHGVAALLYYRLADVTPWLLSHWEMVVWSGLGMAVLGNAMMTSYIQWGQWSRVLWGLPLVLLGSVMWVVGCLLKPEWPLAPFGGLAMFSVLVMPVLVRIMAHYAMLGDELVKVLGMMLVFIGAVAGLHGVLAWMGMI